MTRTEPDGAQASRGVTPRQSDTGLVRTALSLLDPVAGLEAATLPDAAARLADLATRARAELALLDYPLLPWVTPHTGAHGEAVLDVLVVGAGQGGLATAFGLRRERVDNVLVLD